MMKPKNEVTLGFPGKKGVGPGGVITHCQLCGCSQPAVKCDKCDNQVFCLSCDDMYHRHPRRKLHLRRAVDPIRVLQRGDTVVNARPPLQPKNAAALMGPCGNSPIPPPRKKKTRSIFGAFMKRETIPEDSPYDPPRKEGLTWTDRLGSIRRFMANRPLPPLPKETNQDDIPAYTNIDSNYRCPPPRPAVGPPVGPIMGPGSTATLPRNARLSTVGMEDWDDSASLSGKQSLDGSQNWRDSKGGPMSFGSVDAFGRQFGAPGSYFGGSGNTMTGEGGPKLGTMPRHQSLTDLPAPIGYYHPPHAPNFPFHIGCPAPYPGTMSMSHLGYTTPLLGGSQGSWSNVNSTTDEGRDTDDELKRRLRSSSMKRSQSFAAAEQAWMGQCCAFGYPPYPHPYWIPGTPLTSGPPSPSPSQRSLSVSESKRAFFSRRHKKHSQSSRRESSDESSSSITSDSEDEDDKRSKRAHHKSKRSHHDIQNLKQTSHKHSRGTGSSSPSSSVTRRSPVPILRKNSKPEVHFSEVLAVTKSTTPPTENIASFNMDDNVNATEKKTTAPIWDPSKEWQCVHCTFVNPAGSDRICQVCCRTSISQTETETVTSAAKVANSTSNNNDVNSASESCSELQTKTENISSKPTISSSEVINKNADISSFDEKLIQEQRIVEQEMRRRLENEKRIAEENAKLELANPAVSDGGAKNNIFEASGSKLKNKLTAKTSSSFSSATQTYAPTEFRDQSASVSSNSSDSGPKRLIFGQTRSTSVDAMKSRFESTPKTAMDAKPQSKLSNLIRSLSKTSLQNSVDASDTASERNFSSSRPSILKNSWQSPTTNSWQPGSGAYRSWRPGMPSQDRFGGNKYCRSMADLTTVQREQQHSFNAQFACLIQEAEERGYAVEDVQVALNQCDANDDPIIWLDQNWSNMVETVACLATTYGRESVSNTVGMVTSTEAQSALRSQQGNIWKAVTDVVEHRQRKFMELSNRGDFTTQEVLIALDESRGNVDKAHALLSNDALKPLLTRLWNAQNISSQQPKPPMVMESSTTKVVDWLNSLEPRPPESFRNEEHSSNSEDPSKRIERASSISSFVSEMSSVDFSAKTHSTLKNRETLSPRMKAIIKKRQIQKNDVVCNKKPEARVAHQHSNALYQHKKPAHWILENLFGSNDPVKKSTSLAALNLSGNSSAPIATIEDITVETALNVQTAKSSKLSFTNAKKHHQAKVRIANTVDNHTIKLGENSPFLNVVSPSELSSVDNTYVEAASSKSPFYLNTSPAYSRSASLVSSANTSPQTAQKLFAASPNNPLNKGVLPENTIVANHHQSDKHNASSAFNYQQNVGNVSILSNASLSEKTYLNNSNVLTNLNSQTSHFTNAIQPPNGIMLKSNTVIQEDQNLLSNAQFNEQRNTKPDKQSTLIDDSNTNVMENIDSKHGIVSTIKTNAPDEKLSEVSTPRMTTDASAFPATKTILNDVKTQPTTNILARLETNSNDKSNATIANATIEENHSVAKTQSITKTANNKTNSESESIEMSNKNVQNIETKAIDSTNLATSYILAATAQPYALQKNKEQNKSHSNNSETPEVQHQSNEQNSTIKVEDADQNQTYFVQLKTRTVSAAKRQRPQPDVEPEEPEYFSRRPSRRKGDQAIDALLNLKSSGSADGNVTDSQPRRRRSTTQRQQQTSTSGVRIGSDGRALIVKPVATDVEGAGPIPSPSAISRPGPVVLSKAFAAKISKLRSVPPLEKKKRVTVQETKKLSVEKQRQYKTKADQLVRDGKCKNLSEAQIVAELVDMAFEEADALQAVQACDSLEHAINFLQHECEICAGTYPISQMISLLNCTHKACRECLKAYFTIQIRDRNVSDLRCPFCNEPDLTDETVEHDYFNNIDILLRGLVEKDVYDLFQQKLVDRALMKDPNFRWCLQCSSGFIFLPNQKAIQCPDCGHTSCSTCRKMWQPEHEGKTCLEFEQFLKVFDPNNQERALEVYLTENGIDCPRCKFRYALSRGGCMHFKCYQCGFDFCSGCDAPFKMGDKCNWSTFCMKLGLHAHHPRNCLFYLRDKSVDELRQILDGGNVEYRKEAPLEWRGATKCQIPEQKETMAGLRDDVCGKDVEANTAGVCRKHYIEYLGQLIYRKGIDPLPLFNIDELELVLRRANIKLPSRFRISDEEYTNNLKKIIITDIPLEKTDGIK